MIDVIEDALKKYLDELRPDYEFEPGLRVAFRAGAAAAEEHLNERHAALAFDRQTALARLGETTVELIEAKAELDALSKQEPAVLIDGKKVAWNPDYKGPYGGAFYAKAAPDVMRDVLIAQRDELLAACEEFVRKCDSGEARSVRSYAQMKAAIEKCGAQSEAVFSHFEKLQDGSLAGVYHLTDAEAQTKP